ncbi:unnamed protein product [Citrullus colocynthis]|uniref:Uncharacterized protein n=1 Tax=Citrullus colocynthis TaxID=252529 RepID=A0ABP0XTH0_9ROSI
MNTETVCGIVLIYLIKMCLLFVDHSHVRSSASASSIIILHLLLFSYFTDHSLSPSSHSEKHLFLHSNGLWSVKAFRTSVG